MVDARSACCKPVYLLGADVTYVLRHRSIQVLAPQRMKDAVLQGISASPDPISNCSVAFNLGILKALVHDGWEDAYCSAPCSQ